MGPIIWIRLGRDLTTQPGITRCRFTSTSYYTPVARGACVRETVLAILLNLSFTRVNFAIPVPLNIVFNFQAQKKSGRKVTDVISYCLTTEPVTSAHILP